jgi:D-beta-D-heptose 7-phosphate kinase / D-beta-D-heptose 1-phosphate adenosyltransferase
MSSSHPRPVVVIGDVLLDIDVDGVASRLAPDAPVPVVSEVAISPRPGGAGLAALMLATDGVPVTLVTALGLDEGGERVGTALARGGVNVVDVAAHGTTVRKIRVRARGQCVTRIDLGGEPPTCSPTKVHAAIAPIRDAAGVLVADYGRGVAALEPLRTELAPRPHRTVVWDPHPLGPAPVAGAHLVTPNIAEACTWTHDGVAPRADDFPARVFASAEALRSRWDVKAVAVTCGAQGAVLARGDDIPFVVPVTNPLAADSCGAGDRFATAATAALASGAVPTEAVVAGVDAAHAYLARGGIARFTPAPERPSDRPTTVVATSGCFDILHAGHVHTLRAARALGDRLVVLLNSDASVRRIKGADRPLVPAADRAAVLLGLECVDDVVVFDDDTPVRALYALRPAIFVKGGDYDAQVLPEAAALEQWGGRTVVVPYLEGRSTTRIVEEVRNARA